MPLFFRRNIGRIIMKSSIIKIAAIIVAVVIVVIAAYHLKPDTSTPQKINVSANASVLPNTADSELAPLDIKLPKPVFEGTEKPIRVANLRKFSIGDRPPFMAPIGTKNVALGKPVSCSDQEPIIGEIDMITDGDKEAADGSYVELGQFTQNITIDLEAEYNIYAVVIWHYHKEPRVYFDVVLQVADDPDFIANVRTLFNNDIDNSAGFGVGENMHYIETYEGELIDCFSKGVKARYVRLYSNGNNFDGLNHYIEVEVYGTNSL